MGLFAHRRNIASRTIIPSDSVIFFLKRSCNSNKKQSNFFSFCCKMS